MLFPRPWIYFEPCVLKIKRANPTSCSNHRTEVETAHNDAIRIACSFLILVSV